MTTRTKYLLGAVGFAAGVVSNKGIRQWHVGTGKEKEPVIFRVLELAAENFSVEFDRLERAIRELHRNLGSHPKARRDVISIVVGSLEDQHEADAVAKQVLRHRIRSRDCFIGNVDGGRVVDDLAHGEAPSGSESAAGGASGFRHD